MRRTTVTVRPVCATLLLLLTACSSGTSAAAPAATPRVAATATIPADPFPAADVGYDELSPSMKRLWGDYGLTTVPGRAVRANLPAPPPVVNMTGGKVSDADAAVMGRALVWRMRLVQWGASQAQWDFLDWLGEKLMGGSSPFQQVDPDRLAIALSDCFVAPRRLTLWWTDDMSDPVVAWQTVHTYFAFEFGVPCTIKRSGAVIGGLGKPTVWLINGYLFDDPVLGKVWRGYVTPCSSTTNHASQCAVS